jgi:DNA-binding IclR family transcriptional regulator
MLRAQSPESPEHRPQSSPALRLIAEFREMPGLRLTTQQTARLLGVDVQTASTVLTTLVERGVLRVTTSGYILA